MAHMASDFLLFILFVTKRDPPSKNWTGSSVPNFSDLARTCVYSVTGEKERERERMS